MQHRAVEYEHHNARAKLRYSVGKADWYKALVYMRIKAEFPYFEGTAAAQEMHNVYCACYKLGKPRCKGRAVCAHVQYKYCNIVHHTVGQASYYDCYKRGLREAVRLYQYFQIVRYQKESTERRKALKIINGVIKRNVVRAEQACDGLREYKHRRRYDYAHYYKHRQVLG